MNQEYFQHYRQEQSQPDSAITVYRGLGEDFPEPRGSGGSFLQRLSLGSRGSRGSRGKGVNPVDKKSLLGQDGDTELEMESSVDVSRV